MKTNYIVVFGHNDENEEFIVDHSIVSEEEPSPLDLVYYGFELATDPKLDMVDKMANGDITEVFIANRKTLPSIFDLMQIPEEIED